MLDRVIGNRLFAFLFIACQFALVYVVMDRYHVETGPFRQVVALCLAGFAVHFWAPARWRMWVFLLASVASVMLVFGMNKGAWEVTAAAQRGGWLIAIVALIVGVCYLPVSFWGRVGIVSIVGAALIVLRSGQVESPVPPAIWPILGSMLMFRVIVLLYDLKHGSRPQVSSVMAYLLMVPNVCFPLFPVVDFKAFCRGQNDRPALSTYQVGLAWVMRGVVQLLLYRWVYYEVYLDAAQVGDGADVAQFLLVNYLLYLRVSGQFHVIVGLLRMFGFALPETHKRYYLASSFTDYWRRINIYWKDFIMKLVFYPVMFRLKRMPQTKALVIATLTAFAATWALHSYQWYWLLGSFPVAVRDIVFWGALGGLVTINAVWEAKRGRKRSLGTKKWSLREAVVRGLKTAGTFFLICGLWSIWTCRTLEEWAEVMSYADLTTLKYVVMVLGVIFVAAIIPEPAWFKDPSGETSLGAAKGKGNAAVQLVRYAVLTCMVPAVVLSALTLNRINTHLGPDAQPIIRLLGSESKPTEGDVEILERGYYEELIDVGQVNSALSEVFMKRPSDWKRLEQTPALRLSHDYRFRELVPGSTTVVNGVEYRINSAGMRDREYAKAKPEGTYRIAVIGASVPMGWSVEQDGVFEKLAEDALNASGAPRPVEILNFSVNGYSPVCQLVVLEKLVWEYTPDAVLYIAHESDEFWTINRFARAVRDEAPLPGAFAERVARECVVRPGSSQAAAERRVSKRGAELVEWSYAQMADACKGHGVLPVWVYLPRPKESANSARKFEQLRGYAQAAGMEIMDLRGVYDGYTEEELTVAPWDRHPNAKGHAMVGKWLEKALREQPKIGPRLRGE